MRYYLGTIWNYSDCGFWLHSSSSPLKRCSRVKYFTSVWVHVRLGRAYWLPVHDVVIRRSIETDVEAVVGFVYASDIESQSAWEWPG